MQRRPTDAVAAWFAREGFRPTARGDGAYELAYAHSSGFGYVTLRFWPHDYGWDVIVASGDRQAVSLGTCRTLAQMDAVLAVARGFERSHYVDGHGQRLTPSEALVERGA